MNDTSRRVLLYIPVISHFIYSSSNSAKFTVQITYYQTAHTAKERGSLRNDGIELFTSWQFLKVRFAFSGIP